MRTLKRIAFFLLRTAVALIGLIVIGWLSYNAYNGARDLSNAFTVQHQHDQQVGSFPTVATQIAISNATLSYARTHAPSDTPTATDLPTETDVPTAADRSNATDLPTGVPQNVGRFAEQNGPPTNTPRPTFAPDTPTVTFMPSPTATASAVPSTASPTFGKPPTVVMLQPPALKSTQVTAVPSQVPRLKSKDDIINIALTGTDADVDPTDPSYHTDSLIIVSINRTANTVSMLSLPRDLYVFIPLKGMQRINIAFQYGESIKYTPGGGFGLLQQTILYNFGIPVQYYAKISFNNFKALVDSINGVDVAVDCGVTDKRYQGPRDGHTPEPSEYTPFTLKPGYYHMDGSLALWYARMREASSDFDRSRRQQQVLRAIWKTARTNGLIDLSKVSDLWGQLTTLVQTNMTLADVIGLAPIAVNLQPGDVRNFVMYKGYDTIHWTTPLGEDVQLPDPKGFFDTLNRFYTPPAKNRLAANGLSIDIVNSSGSTDLDKVAADRLLWGGFAAAAKGTGDPATKTVIYDYTGSANPAMLTTMLKALNVKASAVQSQPDPNRTVDFKVVLGADYNTCSAPGYGTAAN